MMQRGTLFLKKFNPIFSFPGLSFLKTPALLVYRLGTVFALLIILGVETHAADFTIQDGETVTTTQSLGTGETGLIEEGGTLDVSGADGITIGAGATGVSIINRGQLNFDTVTNGGIFADSTAQYSFENSGNIVVSGVGTELFLEGGVLTSFINTGSIISNFGGLQMGFLGEEIQSFINHGTIQTTDTAVYADSIDTYINTGTITGSRGLFVNFSNPVSRVENSGLMESTLTTIIAGQLDLLVNSGTIRTTSNGSHEAVDIDFGTIINSGLIEGPTGIEMDRSTAGNGMVINSGTIRSTNGIAGVAIDFQGTGDDHLEYRRGGKIEGFVNLGAGNDTLVVQPGLDIVLVADSLPETIDAGNSAVLAVGNTVVVASQSRESESHTILANVTLGISGTVNNRLDNLWNPPNAGSNLGYGNDLAEPNYLIGSNSSGSVTAGHGNPERARRGKRFWIDAFGSYQEKEETALRAEAIHKTGGFVSGVDASVNANMIVGAYAGAAQSDYAGSNGHKATTKTYYGGLYASLGSALGSIDFGLTAGLTDQTEKRQVLNNMSPGGILIATGEKESWFISPELGIERRLPFFGLTGSIRGRYTAQFLDSYGTGTARVAARDISFIQGRAELARPVFLAGHGSDAGVITPYGGIEYNELLDGNIFDITISGQNFLLPMDTEEEALTTFAGLRLNAALSEDFTVNAQVEGRFSDQQSKAVSAKLGGAWKF